MSTTGDEVIAAFMREFHDAFVVVAAIAENNGREVCGLAAIDFDELDRLGVLDESVERIKGRFSRRLSELGGVEVLAAFSRFCGKLPEPIKAQVPTAWDDCLESIIYYDQARWAEEMSLAVERSGRLAPELLREAAALNRQLAELLPDEAHRHIGHANELEATATESDLLRKIQDAFPKKRGPRVSVATEFLGVTLARLETAGARRSAAIETLAPVVRHFFEPDLDEERGVEILTDRVRKGRWKVRRPLAE